MTESSVSFASKNHRYGIWLLGVSFVLFQFFLQLSSGVVIGAIMHEMRISAFAAGILSSAFYYVYTSMQIPVGMLFDRKSTRLLLTANVLVCSVGCVFFAHSHNFFLLMIGRMLIGAGSAFAFVGLSHLLRQHFPLKHFGFMMGLSETLGFIITMLGMISMGALIEQWGWRSFINSTALVGFGIAYCCWRYIPDDVKKDKVFNSRKNLLKILTNGKAWVNGIFVGLSFTVITVFGAMWAVPFVQAKLSCSLRQGSIVAAMIFLGAAVSCPLFGRLVNFFSRRPLMVGSCLSTAGLIFAVLYLPVQSAFILACLMFLIGVCCGAYMLSFSIANELAPAESLSTCTGFTNTLAMLTAPLMQPLVGLLLDLNLAHSGNLLGAYQKALLIIPFSLIVAGGLVFLLPEKTIKRTSGQRQLASS
ncbi:MULTISPECIES: MFS transporter [unclassified Legionella]|uniref:MFS transporter n=1 Tax=unclassified Legionella TaxID=2622702 RepID=UPI001054B3B8|nr:MULTISPECIES: MFS transporter [unclassified Legionella]MDI9819083.1 MFS transporter [Legionella sp. PL877]